MVAKTPASSPAAKRPPRPRSSRRDLVQTEIYDRAALLFAERGYAGTTPQDIADAVGISRQALYYYVRSKEEILAALVSETTTQTTAGMRQIVGAGHDPRETLRRLAYHLVTDRARDRTRFRLLDRSESALPPELAQAFLDGRRQALILVVEVIDKGITDGWFYSTDARVSGLSVLGMCNWVAWWFEPGPDHPIEPIATQIADSAVAMLAAPYSDGRQRPPADVSAVIEAIEQHLDRLRALVQPADD